MKKSIDCKIQSDVRAFAVSTTRRDSTVLVEVEDDATRDDGRPLIVAQLTGADAAVLARALLEAAGLAGTPGKGGSTHFVIPADPAGRY